ncbi:MAG: glycosyltransferase family 4 protein [Chlamydiota bacterium]
MHSPLPPQSDKKIALIKSNLSHKGGIEKYTWAMARHFCDKGIPVTILTTRCWKPAFEHPLLEIVNLVPHYPVSVLNLLHFDYACSRYLKKHPFPVVFSLDRNTYQTHHRAGNGVHAAYLQCRAQEEGLSKKISFCLNPLHRAILHLEKKTFECPELQHLITNSHMVKEQILKHYRTDPSKIEVIHNGVEWQGLQESFDAWEEGKRDTALRHGLDVRAFQLLFIGHNFRRKGLEKLLNALSKIPDRNFQLNVIGKDKDLPFFKRKVEQLRLDGKVFFHGPQANAIPFYQLADALIVPSLYDPFANVTLEALSMGLFVFSSTYNGGKEILTPENGAIIPHLDDAHTFANMLDHGMNKQKTMQSATAIRNSIKHLDFSAQLQKISDLCAH